MFKYLVEQAFVLLKPLIKGLLRKPAIILNFDGGTCSQIEDIVCLQMLKERTGYRMLADVSWYQACEDKSSITARPYNVDKLFEYEKLETASKFQIWIYKLLFSYFPKDNDEKRSENNVDLSKFKLPEAPCYLRGYYSYDINIIEKNYERFLRIKRPEEILDNDNLKIYDKIQKDKKSIGVHVRRGDMAVEGGYWKVVPADYFINVCKIPELQDFTFYFFSEEPEWVTENILPHIKVKYELPGNNPSYYGYKDLFLLSSCQYQVKSQGSFGTYAYVMNNYKNKKLIVYNEDKEFLWEWFEPGSEARL